ncbi:MAG: hypothetical protein ABSB29_08565 [Nitrososphaerales archaeon]
MKALHVSLFSVRARSLLWPALGVLSIMKPPHSFEKLTQYFITYSHSAFAEFW